MRQILYYILLSLILWIFCGTSTVWCQTSKLKVFEGFFGARREIINAYSQGKISKEEYEQRMRSPFQTMSATEENVHSPQKSVDDESKEQGSIRETYKAYSLGQIDINEYIQRSFHARQTIGKSPPDGTLKILPYEDRYSASYSDGDDGTRRYARLQAHGDYTKLKLIVRTKKMDFNYGERIYVKFYVRNDSDGDIHVCRLPSTYYCVHYWKLFHSNYEEVSKTSKMKEEIKKRQGGYGFSWGGEGGYNYQKLQPGQAAELDWKCLNDLFDLSKPDTYELTCFTTSVIRGQKYEVPLQSNTLTFRILETPVAEDYWLRDGVTRREGEPQHIPYTNPPPGEEVFKQPKPPKNVFYIHTNTEPYIEYIDISPYTYYHQKVKEAETVKTEAEKQSGP